MYFVTGSQRERSCDRYSAITTLLVGGQFFKLESLKAYADAGQLGVTTRSGITAKVRIFYSHRYMQWVATTNADETVCNNLLQLPVYSNIGSVCQI